MLDHAEHFEDWLDAESARDAGIALARLGVVDGADLALRRYFVPCSLAERGGRVFEHRLVDSIRDRGRVRAEVRVAITGEPDGDRHCRIAIVVPRDNAPPAFVSLHHRTLARLIAALEDAADVADELRRPRP